MTSDADGSAALGDGPAAEPGAARPGRRQARTREAFVWVWLPGAVSPVVAGRLSWVQDAIHFNYGQSYLARPNAIPLYEPELPLERGDLPPPRGLWIASAIRDGAPDAWGRRVILNSRSSGRLAALRDPNGVDIDQIDELTYLLESGSDRIGNLDFQASPTAYVARQAVPASLDELLQAADLVQQNIPLPPELAAALLHGSALGGARPKALIVDGQERWIAKFSTSQDLYPVVRAEYLAMRLAAAVGLDVAAVRLEVVANRDVLLVRRFDRMPHADGWTRRGMVSGLTLLELDEMQARYASYEDLAQIVRQRFEAPTQSLRELFGRLVFNILCGNTDDHARNHAAFWDGARLSLTPAYDICPQGRAGGEAGQAMLILGNSNLSTLALCLEAAPQFRLTPTEAQALIIDQITRLKGAWDAACTDARLALIERDNLWGRQFLNPFAFQGAPPAIAAMALGL